MGEEKINHEVVAPCSAHHCTADMLRQKRSKKFIFFVVSCNVARTITAYVWDGISNIARKAVPLAKYLPK
jgi:hypothetical protein